MLDSSGKDGFVHLVRFIQEYALLSQVNHPNVITIHDQGFSDDHAYIAVEYFERGDLRALLESGLTRDRALAVTRRSVTPLPAPCWQRWPATPDHPLFRRRQLTDRAVG